VSSQYVLGLDLAKASLPDAIAAMVEAWYDAQGVEPEVLPEPSADLAECIDYILNQTVKPELLDGLGNLGVNPTIKKLLLIRHKQSKNARSNAWYALNRCGIHYKGSETVDLRIESQAVIFEALDAATEIRYGNALLDAPGSQYNKDKYCFKGKDRSFLEMPSCYFIDRCSL
jgi:hypothetical protein